MKSEKKINVLIRTVGGRSRSENIGLGHIYRIINILDILKPGNTFFMLEDFGDAKEIVKEKKYTKIINVKKKISLNEDIKISKRIIKEEKIDLVIIDKYPVKVKYAREIKKKCKTVVISDLKNISFDADLIINGFIGFENKIIKNSKNVKCLLGPKFQILNKKFHKKEKTVKKYDLMVTLGGSNEKKIIKIITDLQKKLNNLLKIKIILGPAFSNVKKIQKHKNLEFVNKTSNMKKEILSSKFGICGGGITTYEFASMNVPFAIISMTNHQLKTAKEWEKYNVPNLGSIETISSKKIERVLKNIINNQNSLKLDFKMTGKGDMIIAREIKKLLFNN